MYYACIGSVRGDCGHKHKKLEAAYRCYQRDQDGCVSQGGYSDRSVYEVSDGTETLVTIEENVYDD